MSPPPLFDARPTVQPSVLDALREDRDHWIAVAEKHPEGSKTRDWANGWAAHFANVIELYTEGT